MKMITLDKKFHGSKTTIIILCLMLNYTNSWKKWLFGKLMWTNVAGVYCFRMKIKHFRVK